MNYKEEIQKCKNDIIYFCENYCLLENNGKLKHVKLREYQKRFLNNLNK